MKSFLAGFILLLLGSASSVVNTATPAQPSGLSRFSVRITELMYQPSEGDGMEFLELKNFGFAPLDLSGCKVDGVKFVFGTNSVLQAGSFGVLISDANPPAFTNRNPGVPVLGVYSGRLSNQGERIALVDPAGRTIDSVTYGTGGFWPTGANGRGGSLEFGGGEGDSNDPSQWYSSGTGGTPGRSGSGHPGSIILLSRVYAGSDSNASVTGARSDFIELTNAGPSQVELSGWSISDRPELPTRYVLPHGTTLAPGGTLSIHCDHALDSGDLHSGFGLDAGGGAVFLFDSRTNRVDGCSYGHQEPGIILVRSGTTWEHKGLPATGQSASAPVQFAPLSSLVLNEWHADSTGQNSDWFEIYNSDATRPALLTGISITNQNAWVLFRWAAVIGPRSFARIWADQSGLPGHADLKLPASGGDLALLEPDGTLIQKVSYGLQLAGASEGRYPDGFTNIIKFPAGGSPGGSNVSDSDADGIPDTWEASHGLDQFLATDASMDLDADGLSNLQEFQAGTDPRNPESTLRLALESEEGGGLQLVFDARPGLSYSLVQKASLNSGTWSKLADFSPVSSNRLVRFAIPNGLVKAPGNFFRLATPAVSFPGEALVVSSTAQPGETNLVAGKNIQINLRIPIDPNSVGASPITLTDERGRLVAGTFKASSDFYQIEFIAADPLLNATSYVLKFDPALKLVDGRSLANEGWTFRTSPSAPLAEDKSVYSLDPLKLFTASIRLLPQPGGFTLADVNADDDPNDAVTPKVDVIWSEGSFGAGASQPNGIIEQRGQSTRLTAQKSYKVHLSKSGQAWNGLRELNFNKHPYDLTRVRNKLALDLLSKTPHMPSLRTIFFKLLVDGNNLGLFTLVEDPGPDSLEAHGFDRKGHLYKAHEFEFRRYPDQLKVEGDPLYDASLFNQILEIKGSGGHAKLLRMLDDVNNDGVPVERVMANHFHYGNYVNWLASCMLLDNEDTTTQNFLLYSPSGSSTWYFMPWDYDGALGFYQQPDQASLAESRPRWTEGIANWWVGILHRRFLSETNNVALLQSAVNSLAEDVLGQARVRSLLAEYKAVMGKEVFASPDYEFLPVRGTETAARQAEWETEYSRLQGVIESRRTLFLRTLARPMPFYLGTPELTDSGWVFVWDASYQLQKHEVTYDFVLSKSPGLEDSARVLYVSGLKTPRALATGKLASGRYYFKVIARDATHPDEDWQIAFDSLTEGLPSKTFHGVAAFDVP